MSLQRKAFDPSLNPFLRTANPFRVQQKFYPQASSQEKFKKGYFTKHFYDSNCDHCNKNVPLLEELNTRSTFLKAQKQNLHKVSSAKFKTNKVGPNPFEKSRLINESIATPNQAYSEYSRHDEGKLQSLLYNNPFKKYVQQKQNIEHDKEFEIEFKHIEMVKLTLKQKMEREKRESLPRVNSPSCDKKLSARFSIESMSYRMNYNQNSPSKKSKFSPTIGDIAFASNRGSSSRNSIAEVPSNDHRMSCLIQQITQSRKDVFEHHRQEKEPEIRSYPTSQTKLHPKSPQKQANEANQKDSRVITVRGRKFYLNQVKFRY